MTLQEMGAQLPVAALWAGAIAIVVVTLLPLADTNAWWVRALDFPRPQIAFLAGLVLLLSLLLPGMGRLIIPVTMIACCGYHLWRVYPYTPLAQVEMTLADTAPDEIRILSANVLMENRRHDLVLDAIDRVRPEILLLMETDQTWLDALEPALSRYSTVVRAPKDNHYGMIFATTLPVDDARIVELTAEETPSLFAQLTAPNGKTFRFVGLHPRPPVPGEDTDERDAKIYYAARFARTSQVPVVVTGDFNDVAWSDTSRTFKHVGQYLDPRIGRGFCSSFDAEKVYLRFPIDQLYVTQDIAVVALERLDYVGSDHFPMFARIRVDAELASRLNAAPQPVSESEHERVEEIVSRMRSDLGHETF